MTEIMSQKNLELIDVPRRKYYFMGEILRTDSLSLSGMRLMLQTIVDKWMGKGKVVIELKDEGVNAIKFILYRTYEGDYNEERFLPDGSYRFSSDEDSIYAMDQQLIMGKDYKNPRNWVGAYVSARLFHSKDDVIKIYKKAAKQNHTSKIKNVTIQEFPDRLEMTVELL